MTSVPADGHDDGDDYDGDDYDGDDYDGDDDHDDDYDGDGDHDDGGHEGDGGHDYATEVAGETLEVTPYREGVHAYLRWRHGDRSGLRGGVTGDGRFVADVDAFIAEDGDAETLPLPDDLHAAVLDELQALRDEGVEEQLGGEAAEAFREDRRVFRRAREILEREGQPDVEEGDRHTVTVDVGDGIEVGLRAVARDGLAEVQVSAGDLEGYAPRYELGERRLTLPAMGNWRFTREIEVPGDVADALLDDLTALQEALNARREAYDDAVERARDDVLDDG